MKWYALIMVFVVAAVVACKTDNSQQAEQARQDSLRQADSITAALQAAEVEKEEQRRQDSIEWASFQSKDLAFYGLHGHVKTLKADYQLVEFDENGNVQKVDGKDPFNASYEDQGDSYYSLSRNEEGYLSTETGWEWSTDYTWKDGRIVSYYNVAETWTTKATYTYDDEGNLIEEKGTSSEYEGDTEKFRYKYTYTKRDVMGNWTERKSNNGNKTRVITYYEMPAKQ